MWQIIHLQPFGRPQAPGEMLGLGLILSETTHKVWQWTSDGERPFVSSVSDQNPTRVRILTAICLIAVEKPL